MHNLKILTKLFNASFDTSIVKQHLGNDTAVVPNGITATTTAASRAEQNKEIAVGTNTREHAQTDKAPATTAIPSVPNGTSVPGENAAKAPTKRVPKPKKAATALGSHLSGLLLYVLKHTFNSGTCIYSCAFTDGQSNKTYYA